MLGREVDLRGRTGFISYGTRFGPDDLSVSNVFMRFDDFGDKYPSIQSASEALVTVALWLL